MARRNLKQNILILEENPYHLELLTALLGREFAHVPIDTSESRKNYALIFCDKPEKIAFLKNRYPRASIIVLDSLSDETRATQAIKLGAEEYLPKNRTTLETLPQLLKEWGLKTP